MKKDSRRTHRGQTASGGQSELVVVVGVGRDFVSAVDVFGVGQEGVLEPGYEFALEPLLTSALIIANNIDGLDEVMIVRKERTS